MNKEPLAMQLLWGVKFNLVLFERNNRGVQITCTYAGGSSGNGGYLFA